MNKAIFIDLDGTLIYTKHGKHKVSLENIQAIKKAQREGWFVILTTGRAKEDMIQVWEQIKYYKMADYVIHSAGSVIENFGTNEIFKNEPIPEEVATNYLHNLIFINASIKIVDNPSFFAPKINWKTKLAKTIFGINFKLYGELTASTKNPNKIGAVVSFSRKKTGKIRKELQEKFKNLTIVTTGSGFYIEATNIGVNKGSAILKLSEIADIDLINSIAIGDSMNDVEMMKIVGIPVAMHNATKELKEVAKYKTHHVKNNGVAKAIDEFTKKDTV